MYILTRCKVIAVSNTLSFIRILFLFLLALCTCFTLHCLIFSFIYLFIYLFFTVKNNQYLLLCFIVWVDSLEIVLIYFCCVCSQLTVFKHNSLKKQNTSQNENMCSGPYISEIIFSYLSLSDKPVQNVVA